MFNVLCRSIGEDIGKLEVKLVGELDEREVTDRFDLRMCLCTLELLLSNTGHFYHK